MTGSIEVRGRPSWARNEPVAIQRLIVEHKLSADQLRTLREFVYEDVAATRRISHSLARALRARGLGELTGKFTPGTLDRRHPTATFQLNAAGRALAQAMIVTDKCPMGCHEEQAAEPRRYHPPEWDE